jgi:hypothetical protein
MIPEAPLEREEGGLAPRGEGWFVLNARQSTWLDGPFGAYTRLEGDVRLAQFGVNIAVLEPGQPACWYHGEDEEETHSADEAYASVIAEVPVPYREGWLPG